MKMGIGAKDDFIHKIWFHLNNPINCFTMHDLLAEATELQSQVKSSQLIIVQNNYRVLGHNFHSWDPKLELLTDVLLTSLAFLTSTLGGVMGDICGGLDALASNSRNSDLDFLLISVKIDQML